MIRKMILAGAFLAAMAAPALADPIEGAWKTKAGDDAMISSCGGSFCIKLTSGEFSGKSIAEMKADGDNDPLTAAKILPADWKAPSKVPKPGQKGY